MTKQELLDELRKQELNDLDLPLKETATNLVFGYGNANAKIIFIGEAPGKNEDAQALPFAGAAGKILDQLLDSIHLDRDEIFITSVVHYRPPKNRQPKPSEIEAFSKYLDQIIEIIDPKVIATLGNFSLHKFLPKVNISEVHGKVFETEFQGKNRVIIPLYHPAAVLYRRSLPSLGSGKRDFMKTLEKDFLEISKNLE